MSLKGRLVTVPTQLALSAASSQPQEVVVSYVSGLDETGAAFRSGLQPGEKLATPLNPRHIKMCASM
jgi:hypothetical protein